MVNTSSQVTQGPLKDGVPDGTRNSKTAWVFKLLWQFPLKDGTTFLGEIHCLEV